MACVQRKQNFKRLEQPCTNSLIFFGQWQAKLKWLFACVNFHAVPLIFHQKFLGNSLYLKKKKNLAHIKGKILAEMWATLLRNLKLMIGQPGYIISSACLLLVYFIPCHFLTVLNIYIYRTPVSLLLNAVRMLQSQDTFAHQIFKLKKCSKVANIIFERVRYVE